MDNENSQAGLKSHVAASRVEPVITQPPALAEDAVTFVPFDIERAL